MPDSASAAWPHRGTRQVRLDEYHVRGPQRGPQGDPVERADGGGIQDGDVHALGGPEHLVGQRADRDDRAARPRPQHREAIPGGGQRPGVGLQRHPQVHQAAGGGRGPQQRPGLVRVAGNVHGPARQGVQQGHITRGLVRPAVGRFVVGPPGADQHGADALMHQIQLDLLEGPLDQEGGEGVRDRPHSGQGQAARHADQELLADTQVDNAVRMPLAGRRESLGRDVGEHDGEPRVAVEQLARHPHEAFPHGLGRPLAGLAAGHEDAFAMLATTTCGRSGCGAVSACCSAA